MKHIKTMIMALVCAFAMVSAQAQESANNDTTIYTIVDEMPQFQGGDSALVDYITHNVHYPQAEKAQGIQGKVYVGFVVEKDGSISNVEVKRGIGEECDAEAVRVVKDMPAWIPGKRNGEPVRVSSMLPINYKIVELPPPPPIDTFQRVTLERMPAFPGGEEALMNFISTNLRYPQYAIHHNIYGRVFVRFVVEPDGTVSNVEVLRGIGGGCDEEAVRVAKMMPDWIPGEAFGEKVRVSYLLPINFRLSDYAPEIDPTLYTKAEKMPSFPGGEIYMHEFIARNIRYPQQAREDGYSGTVYIKFVVEVDGSLSNIEVVKGVGGGCTEEALRIVKIMPKWDPGEISGKKVRVSYTVPFNFRLQ
jgi:TonB family protein